MIDVDCFDATNNLKTIIELDEKSDSFYYNVPYEYASVYLGFRWYLN